MTVVVPFSAGGPTDALIRTLGERMHQSLGQPVLVENVTGAAGTIGVGRVAKAAPDGYTLSFGHWSTHVINGAVYPLPFDLLTDCEGGRREPVQIDVADDSRITARWHDGGIPQVARYDAPGSIAELPLLPVTMAGNPARLLTALDEAAGTTDDSSVRYALGAIQLQGASGRIAASDGRQILVASGFTFPWPDDILIPHNSVFGSRELAESAARSTSDPVAIGIASEWVALRVGPWTIWLDTVKEGKFPKVMDHLPRPGDAKTVLRLSDADAEFLHKSIKRLPAADDFNRPVTIDANGSLIVRSAEYGQRPTELLLSSSKVDGQAVQLNTNREYLARATKLGFRNVHLYGPEAPALCCDEHRSYVWAILGKEGVVKPSDQAVRIESPLAGDAQSHLEHIKEEQHTPMSNNSNTHSNGSEINGQSKPDSPAEALSVDALIESAEVVKLSLRESATRVSELIADLKRHRRKSKTLQSALLSIRQLQAIDA